MTLERRRKTTAKPDSNDAETKAAEEHRTASDEARREAAERAAELVNRLREL